ncbi:MAG: hypothetical protein Q4G27_10835 [Flavobacteriaceae bacterium]|nr:hypothetical protein [Flavobacteriaceae bacterium]
MHDKFEEHIKSRLQNHEISPPPGAWENISKELQKEKTRIIPWRRRLAIAAAILVPALLSIGFLWFNNNEIHKSPSILQENLPVITHSPQPEVRVPDSNQVQKTISQNENPISIESLNQNIATEKPSPNFHNGIHRMTGFIQKIFNSEQDYSHSNERFASNTSQNSLKQRKVNIFSALTAPFQTSSRIEMTSPELFALNSTQNNHFLQITTIGATEESPKNEVKMKEIKPAGKFSISPFAGAAMLGSFNQMSLITPEFNQLDVKSKWSKTYGAHASYQLNDRIKIRTGVGIIDIRQDTYDVPFKINETPGSVNYNMRSYSNISPDISSFAHYETHLVNLESTYIQGIKQDIEQHLQLVEIPMEMEYNLKKGKKISVAATGGVSTLVRNQNDVYAMNTTSLIARPTNVKSVSFSANAGVKLDYKLTEKASVKVEPQMKYMINTVTGNDQVQPYLLGVNVGLSYSL